MKIFKSGIFGTCCQLTEHPVIFLYESQNATNVTVSDFSIKIEIRTAQHKCLDIFQHHNNYMYLVEICTVALYFGLDI